MRWFFYNLFFAIGYTAMLPHFLLRMRRRGGYRARWRDRLGRYDEATQRRLNAADGPRRIWIHAVSVGEVYVAGQLMRELRRQAPTLRFVLSTTSSTGWREAEKQLAPEDVLIYNPLDFPGCVRRALDAIRPDRYILIESEIWPNLLRACAARGIPAYLVNARVSDRSAPGYRGLRLWFGPVLRSLRLILAQSDLDRQRLLAAGADPARTRAVGSVKFDVAARNPEKEALAAAILAQADMGPDRVVLVGGSTWPGEEAALLGIYARLRAAQPNLRLVLVPRHFERGEAVAAEIEQAGFVCIRRSRLTSGAPPAADGAAVLLVDTTGEMMGFYGNADLVFVGKSLCAHGAQNMIEPCLCGVATVVGPHTENFRPVMADLLAADALIQVPDAAALERELTRLAGDPAARRELGCRAAAAVNRRRGVVGTCAGLLLG
ncbi:MAG: 3-deoxy-D-manno-octulosonic acid transferase [Lentisphaerota bacterium]